MRFFDQLTSFLIKKKDKRVGISNDFSSYLMKFLVEKVFLKLKKITVLEARIKHNHYFAMHGKQAKAELPILFLERKIDMYDKLKLKIERLANKLDLNKKNCLLNFEVIFDC